MMMMRENKTTSRTTTSQKNVPPNALFLLLAVLLLLLLLFSLSLFLSLSFFPRFTTACSYVQKGLFLKHSFRNSNELFVSRV